MEKITKKLGILLFGLFGLINISHAALNDLGNGLVNDDVLNITWMQDANLFKTLCDANINDPIMVSYNSLMPVWDATTACADSGRINWNDAEKFIAALNSNNYLGGGWRQPFTVQPDATCSIQTPVAGIFPTQGGGYNCTGSELGNLFNVSLANPDDGDGSNCYNPTTGPAYCFQNTGPFSNPQFSYWSSAHENAFNTLGAWFFGTYAGFQGVDDKDYRTYLFVWPVRSGQSMVPPPATPVPTLSLWGLGIMTLLLGFVARRKAR